MANAASLTNFSSPSLDIGDWLYSIYPRSAPGYLPLNDATATYLQASYPTLVSLLNNIYKVSPTGTQGTLPAASQYAFSLAYGGGTYVGVGFTAAYSTDGVNWSASSPPANSRAVAYGAGVFAVVGATSGAATSPDGFTWTTRTLTTTFAGQNIIFAAGLFVAVGGDYSAGPVAGTNAYTSPTGVTWTVRTIPSNLYGANGFKTIAYGAGLIVALPSAGGTITSYATSPDGITWTARTSPITSGYFTGLAYGNGIFVAITNTAGTYYTSTDGITWTVKTNGLTSGNIEFGDGVFVVASGGTAYSYTTDTTVWKSGTLPLSNPSSTANSIVYGAASSGTFVIQNSSNGPSTTGKLVAAISTTQFTLPVVTALTNTFTYVKAT